MERREGYETVYRVGLLDDLHNYFPALLYDQGRFHSLQSVFHYIRSQMNARFNLYAFGARRWREQEEDQLPVIFTIPTHAPPPTVVPPMQTTGMQNNVTLNPLDETIVDTNLAATTLLLSLLGGTPRTPRLPAATPATQAAQLWANFLNPIVTRPTPEQIQTNTELVTGLTDTSCAICQDMIRSEDMARRLRPCRHVYHQTCIDQWFERSVFCPTCRHDIREVAPQEQEPNE